MSAFGELQAFDAGKFSLDSSVRTIRVRGPIEIDAAVSRLYLRGGTLGVVADRGAVIPKRDLGSDGPGVKLSLWLLRGPAAQIVKARDHAARTASTDRQNCAEQPGVRPAGDRRHRGRAFRQGRP